MVHLVLGFMASDARLAGNEWYRTIYLDLQR